MSRDLAVLVPVLRRPHRVVPLLEAIEATTPDARVVFLCDARDPMEHRAIRRARLNCGLRVDSVILNGNYAMKITKGVATTHEQFLFLGADDLIPQPGWFEVARAHLTDGVEVVGVNDLIERTRLHATHFLMTRSYAEQPTIDGGPGPFHHGYAHWACDDELIATAKHRGAYAYAPEAHVRHEHPMADTAPDDATYQKGRARARQDLRLLRERTALWT